MAISSLGLSGIYNSAAQSSGFVTTAPNMAGQYQNPAMWDQDRAYREEMIRREMEYKYRQEIERYAGLANQQAKQEAPVQKVKAVPADNFPEGREKNLLLLLEH